MASVTSTTCKLCYEEYSVKSPERIPRLLQCKHIFCTECLQKLNRLQEKELSIVCPSCSTVTIPPVKGIDYLPKAERPINNIVLAERSFSNCEFCIEKTHPPKYATLHCVSCHAFYCGACSDEVHLKVENQEHVLRLANSIDDLHLSKIIPARVLDTKVDQMSDEKPSHKIVNSENSICYEHRLYLTMYCHQDKTRCCIKCRLSDKHQSHDCDMAQTHSDKEKNSLIDWQIHIEEEIQKHNKAIINVQRTMEQVKYNTKYANELVQKVLWELRSVIDQLGDDLIKEISIYSDSKLTRLHDQCSQMIEHSDEAQLVSKSCEDALHLKFFEKIAQKKRLEPRVVNALEMLQQNMKLCETPEVFVQFPKYEALLTSLKNCSYLVKVPPPPCDFECSLTGDEEVSLKWNAPKYMKYTFPVTLYNVYASGGEDDLFVSVEQTTQTSYCMSPCAHTMLRDKMTLRFQVACINVIGESKPCSSICIRVVNEFI